MCRYGAVGHSNMGGSDFGPAIENGGYDANGKPIYKNKFSVN